MFLLRLIWAVVHALFARRADLVAEILALRQQLIVFRRKVRRPKLRRRDRDRGPLAKVVGQQSRPRSAI